MKKKSLSYYALLGIEPNATDKEIKAGYRNKVNAFHSDKHQDDSEDNEFLKHCDELVSQFNDAKDCLLDPALRLEHDYNIGVKQRPIIQPPHTYILPSRYSFSGGEIFAIVTVILLVGGIIGYGVVGSGKSK